MPRAVRGPRLLIIAMSEPAMANYNSFAAQLAEALETSWPAIARPNQLPPPGNWQVWLLLAGRGFGKTRTLAEWGMPAGGIRTGRQDCSGRRYRRRCARRLGRRPKRHSGGLAAVVPAGLRTLETTADLAEWGHGDNLQCRGAGTLARSPARRRDMR